MAPFPETEIMTIKRLEVALRKMDFKLLKDGAYKLHEKYHSGHRFEYIDLLKELYVDISNNMSIPSDIKDILVPTIEDILSEQIPQTEENSDYKTSYTQNKVSSLTSLSYNSSIKQEEKLQTEIKEQQNSPNKIYTQSPFVKEPFKEFYDNQDYQTRMSLKEETQQGLFDTSNQTIEYKEEAEKTIEQPQENIKENIEENGQKIENTIQKETDNKVREETKSIAIFFSQNNSDEKIKNISRLKAMFSNLRQSPVGEMADLIKEINTQANTNVVELQVILEQLKSLGHNINLVTNSQSAEFIDLFNSNNIKYGIFNPQNENDINFLPLFGLTNRFKCHNCSHELQWEDKNNIPIILQCPKCKDIMTMNVYGAKKGDCTININYYNSCAIAMANSKIWLLIHPSLDEKITFNMLRSALKISNQVKEIYILDKDINVRETYKKAFLNINENIKINTQMNALEDFFNLVK